MLTMGREGFCVLMCARIPLSFDKMGKGKWRVGCVCVVYIRIVETAWLNNIF